MHRSVMRSLFVPIGILSIVTAILVGCTVKFVADYDEVAFEETLRVGKEVDKFYGELLESKADERAYQGFSGRYVEIESDIQSLLMRNSSRALNEESTEISRAILKLWLKYKAEHKSTDTYPDGQARRDRGRFSRLFAAAASAERVRSPDADDRDIRKDSKEVQ